MGYILPPYTARALTERPIVVPVDKDTLVYDLRKSFGEDSASPHVKDYERLPMEELKEFTHRSTCMHARQMRDMLISVGSATIGVAAFASDFKTAAAGALAVTTWYGVDLYRSLKRHDRLQEEILAFARK